MLDRAWHESEKLGYEDQIRNRFFRFAEEFEVYPFIFEDHLYFEWELPEDFRRSFETFIERDVLIRMLYYLKEYSQDPELFRTKFIRYILDLFDEQCRRIREGIIFWTFDLYNSMPWETDREKLYFEIVQFFERYRESLFTIISYSIQPEQEKNIPLRGDALQRDKLYADLIERVREKARKPLP